MSPAPPTAPPEPAEPALIFQWERRSHVHWRLAALVGASLLAHALSFYVFQVAYTPTGSQPPPPAQVMLIPLEHASDALQEREKIHSLTQWLAMSDPSMVTRPALPSAAEELAAVNFRYVPSYVGLPPGFKALEPSASENPAPAPPRPRPLGPVPASALREGAAASPTAAARHGAATKVVLTGEIAAPGPTPLPPVRFVAAGGSKPLEPTTFLVGVRADGQPPFLFRQGESGNKAADDFAHDYLAALAFRPAVSGDAGAVAWGWAEFDWGNDVYR